MICSFYRNYPFCSTDAFTAVINLLFFAFAVNEWMLYIGGLIAILDSTTTTMLRSMISKMVHANEVGKVFSILGVFQVSHSHLVKFTPNFYENDSLFSQALIPFIAGPSFNFLYKHTVRTFPAAFIFVVIGLKSLVFIDVLIVYFKSRKVQKKKAELEMENQRQNKRKLGDEETTQAFISSSD